MTRTHQFHALFVQSERALQRNVAALKIAHTFFKLLERCVEAQVIRVRRHRDHGVSHGKLQILPLIPTTAQLTAGNEPSSALDPAPA